MKRILIGLLLLVAVPVFGADKSFTAVGNGPDVLANPGDTVTYSASGTFVGTALLQQFVGGGWVTQVRTTGATSGTFVASSCGSLVPVSGCSATGSARLRWRADAYTSGTIVTTVTASGQGAIGGVYHQATVTLTDTQIKALPSTAITVIPAVGENKTIVPVSAVMRVDASAGAYTADGDASWLLMWAGGTYATAPSHVHGILTNAAIYFLELPPGGFLDAVGAGQMTSFDGIVTGSGALIQTSDTANKDLQIKDDYAGVMDYTGGNAANTAIVTITYLVFDVITGALQ